MAGSTGCFVEERTAPFSFLDIACGDASATVGALQGTAVARYCGIDRSATALALAKDHLSLLDCPVALHEADFVDLLAGWREPVDVAWIGLSLHHYRTPEKVGVLRAVRRILRAGGILVIYENTSPDGEDREGWLRRWDGQRPAWTAYTADDWEIASSHVHAADFPETDSRWRDLGREAGFAEISELYAAPTNLFRLYAFRG